MPKKNIIKYKSISRISLLDPGLARTSHPTLTLDKALLLPGSRTQLFGKRRHCVTASLIALWAGLRNISKVGKIWNQSNYILVLHSSCVGPELTEMLDVTNKRKEPAFVWWAKKSLLQLWPRCSFLKGSPHGTHTSFNNETAVPEAAGNSTVSLSLSAFPEKGGGTQEAGTDVKVTYWLLCQVQYVGSHRTGSGWRSLSPERTPAGTTRQRGLPRRPSLSMSISLWPVINSANTGNKQGRGKS